MAGERWSYQVVELKGFLGVKRDVVQDKLTQLGLQGWELVSVVQAHPIQPVLLYLKKPL